MSQKDDGRSAFPHQAIPNDKGWLGDSPGDDGMTLRQWYAGQALAGTCADPNQTEAGEVARFAVSCADALIAELDKEDE